MYERDQAPVAEPYHLALTPRYLSSSDLEVVLQLLMELRATTLSQASFAMATTVISDLGGADRLPPDALESRHR